jgi:hypothetical protein
MVKPSAMAAIPAGEWNAAAMSSREVTERNRKNPIGRRPTTGPAQ